MSQQHSKLQPPRGDQSSDFQDDPFAYLEQGAVVPPRRPLQLRRTSSRRGFIGVGVAAIGAAAWFGVPLNTEGAFHPGTQVAGLNIGELNRPQAKTLMRTHFADFENTAVDYTFEQQHWNASLAQLGFAIDYDATLDVAWQNGRTASRTTQFKSVFLRPEVKSFPLIFSSDPEQLQMYLQDLGTQIVGAARDAALYLDGDQVRIRPNEDGRALDIDAAATATNRVVQSAQRGTVELTAQPVVSQITAERLEPKRQLAQTMINASIRIDTGEDLWTVSQSTLRAALVLPPEGVLADATLDENIIGQTLDEMAAATYREPADATLGWDGGLIVVEADVRGRELDIEATASAVAGIAQQSTNRVVSAVFTEKLAEVNSQQLDSLGIIDLVAEGDSNFDGSSWERAENVRVSARHLNHTMVKPGETYSFLDSIGMITEVNGFVPGKIIRGGWYVSDIGGGACQA
ncbi:MAG: peptidoglycan binding domain-containing protein, partial [Thermomicrobiales bacterium]|nr:peptidoglycan binding domain-containing protein [Thermomicrobiales bacterium]